jgi:hypothetical protein
MENLFSQINLKDWSLSINKPIAVINLDPIELEGKLKIKFNQSFDDLDYYNIAVMELQNGKQFCLVRYRGNPFKGTEIWVSDKIENIEMELNGILNALNIDLSCLSWILEKSNPAT